MRNPVKNPPKMQTDCVHDFQKKKRWVVANPASSVTHNAAQYFILQTKKNVVHTFKKLLEFGIFTQSQHHWGEEANEWP